MLFKYTEHFITKTLRKHAYSNILKILPPKIEKCFLLTVYVLGAIKLARTEIYAQIFNFKQNVYNGPAD